MIGSSHRLDFVLYWSAFSRKQTLFKIGGNHILLMTQREVPEANWLRNHGTAVQKLQQFKDPRFMQGLLTCLLSGTVSDK